MEGASLDELASAAKGFEADSRLIKPGDLFFALSGQQTDGHQFLEGVAAKGAIGAVVDARYAGDSYGLPLVRVPEVMEALQELARKVLARRSPTVIAITGSVGKTTAKEMVAALLSKRFKVGKTEGSRNTQITLPLTILNFSGEEDLLVLEMGMSLPGELTRLVQVAPPDLALVTRVSLAHAQNFEEGVLGIARAKAEILSQEKTKCAVLHAQLYEYGSIFTEKQEMRLSFSLDDPKADYYLGKAGDRYFIDEQGVRAALIELPFHEPSFLHNFIAAVAVARRFKLGWNEIEEEIPHIQLPKMRFEKKVIDGVLFINDAYNASPDSVRAALSQLPPPASGGKTIAVLGPMGELGPFSRKCHSDIGKFALPYIDHLLCLDEECAPLCEAFEEVKKPAELFSQPAALSERLLALIHPGDVVLVKGRRDMKMEQIIPCYSS